jgi:hypothetical protein
LKHAVPVVYKLPDGLTLSRQKDKWSILDEGVYALSKRFDWVYIRHWSSLQDDVVSSILYDTVESAYNHWEDASEKRKI